MSVEPDSAELIQLDSERFALTEYQSIATSFANGLNAMAVLLSLFFVFTGAVLNYVAGLFNDLTKELGNHAPPGMVVGWLDFRLWQIYFICLISVVFTIWSASFVFAFRNGAGKMFARASEIEAHFPGISDSSKRKFFTLMHGWYAGDEGWSSLRTLYFSTVAFYACIFVSYAAILWFTFKFWP